MKGRLTLNCCPSRLTDELQLIILAVRAEYNKNQYRIAVVERLNVLKTAEFLQPKQSNGGGYTRQSVKDTEGLNRKDKG